MPTPSFSTRIAAAVLGGVILGAAATVGAQQGFTLLNGIVGLPPGSTGIVACVTPGGAALRNGVTPTTTVAMISTGSASQTAVLARCPA